MEALCLDHPGFHPMGLLPLADFFFFFAYKPQKFLIVLEATSPRPRCCQFPCLVRACFLVLGRLSVFLL